MENKTTDDRGRSYEDLEKDPRVRRISDVEIIERIYGHPMHYIQCMCSSAHTYGNITACVQNWLLKLFPPDLFKTIHVNSKIAHTQLRSTPKEFLKKTPPMFIIRPRLDINDTNKFLHGTPIIERQGDLYNTYGMTNLQPFFKDVKNKLAIKYQLNRDVMYFDVILIFQTLMQQLNWVKYFQNAVRQDIPFNIETCLESYLSKELLLYLSDFSGVPMKDEDGGNKKFLRYLNANSDYPITYKLQGSTKTDEYYRYYPVKIDSIISNLDIDQGEKVGHISDRYQVTFSMRCEVNTTGFYYLFSDKINHHTIVNVNDDSTFIVPVFTDVLGKEDIDLPIGWHLYASPSCRLEFEDDEVDLSGQLNTSIKECLKFHAERGIPTVEFFKLRVRKQGQLLTPGKDYIFDIDTLKVKFIKGSTFHTYKFIIMINIEYINNLIKDIYNLK